MNIKKCIILIMITIFLLSIAGVSAADRNDSSLDLSQADEKEIINLENQEIINDVGEGTFAELESKINNCTDSVMTLDKNYTYEGTGYPNGIAISKQITIDGNGYTINANKQTRIFDVQSDDGVILKNIIFINGNSSGNGGALCFGYAENCIFIDNTANNGGAVYGSSTVNCTFIGNTAENGGAMWGGSSYKSMFISNNANYGGAVYFQAQDLGAFVSGCIFLNNTGDSGIIYFNNEVGANSLTVINNIFLNNSASAIVFYRPDSISNCNFNWLGANATNYMINPDLPNCNEWLFLNATSTPNTFSISNISNIIFKLFSFNSYNVREYDNDLLYPVELTLTGVNGNVQKTTGLDKTITFAPTHVGTGSITASFENTQHTIELTIYKANSTLNIENMVFDYNTVGTINISFFNANTVVANVVGHPEAKVSVDGNIISVSNLNAGKYILNVTTVVDDNHNPVSKTANITVNKINSTLTVNNIEFNYMGTGLSAVSFTGATGLKASVINHPDAAVKVEGTNIAVSGLDVGTYILTVTTITDNNYIAVTKNATITVNKLQTELIGSVITPEYNKDLVFILKDFNGNPVCDVSVTVDLNGAKTYTTDKQGQIKLSTKDLLPKNYDVKLTFEGNANYKNSTSDIKVTVNKATPKLSAKKKTFKSSLKTKKYFVTLNDNVKSPIKKAKLSLKVNGKTYNAKTNSKGKAVFKITKLNGDKTFKAVIKYNGDTYYNKLAKKVKIKVITTFKTISRGSKDKEAVKEIQQALKDKGYYQSYRGHYLKVDGKFNSQTFKSVKKFQHDKGLKVTGKVDEKTAKKLGIL